MFLRVANVRVPETITETEVLVATPDSEIKWQELENGYKIHAVKYNYGDVSQRWLLVYSEQAFEREKKTFEKRLDKEHDKLEKALWHLSNETFECEPIIWIRISTLNRRCYQSTNHNRVLREDSDF